MGGPIPIPEGVEIAAMEIAQSEESYLGDVKVLKDVFLSPLKKWTEEQGKDQMLCQVTRLLDPLENVIRFAETFRREMTIAETKGQWRSLFERNEKGMARNYGAYVAEYYAVWPEIAAWKSSEALDAFLRCCELQPANARAQSLKSLAIMPVQRGPRYALLLETLLQRAQKENFSYPDPGGDDLGNLQAAFECAKRAAKAIDNEVAEEEHRRDHLKKVASAFVSSAIVQTWDSRTVMKDDALMRTTKQRSHADAYFVLFDERLAYGDALDQGNSSSNGLQKSSSRRRRSSSGLSATSPGSSSPTEVSSKPSYALREEVDVGSCCAARGVVSLDDEECVSSVARTVALDPWEFIVAFLRPSETTTKAVAFIVAAATPTLASDWVDAVNAAADKRRRLVPPVQPFPDKFTVSAYVHRQGRIVVADYELHRAPKELEFRAKPKGSALSASASTSTAIAMPVLQRETSSSPRLDRHSVPLQRPVPSFVDDDETSSPVTTSRRSSVEQLRGADLFGAETSVLRVRVDSALGLELRTDDNAVVVASVASGPALDAGINPGDTILHIRGRPVHSTTDVLNALNGITDVYVDVVVKPRSSSEALPPPPPPPRDYSYPLLTMPAPAPPAPPVVDPHIQAQALVMGFSTDDVHRALSAGVAPDDMNSIALWILDNPPSSDESGGGFPVLAPDNPFRPR